MAHAKVTRRDWDDEAQALMAPSAAASAWSLVEGFTDNLGRSHLWEIEAGPFRALIALRGLELQQGRLLEVAGYRSLGDRIPGRALCALDVLARDQYGADLLSMTTRHAHLVRACERAGWHAVAQTAVKPLNPSKVN